MLLLLLSPAWSASFSTDNGDLWYAHNEEAWGMQLVQRADVIYATLYVYDDQNQPIFDTPTLTYVGAYKLTQSQCFSSADRGLITGTNNLGCTISGNSPRCASSGSPRAVVKCRT